jgi:hypothetical protein
LTTGEIDKKLLMMKKGSLYSFYKRLPFLLVKLALAGIFIVKSAKNLGFKYCTLIGTML